MPVLQRNIYIIDGYCVVVNKNTGKEEMLDVQQALADQLFVQTVPSIAENMGGGSACEKLSAPFCSVLMLRRCFRSLEQGAGPRRRTLGDDRGVIRCGYEQVLELHKRRCVALHTCRDVI